MRELRLLLPALLLSAACASGPGPGASASSADGVDPWIGLAAPRPIPLDGAPRLTVTEAAVAMDPWGFEGGDAGPALGELVTAILLERRDIEFTERKRFAPAAERQRTGQAPEAGQPPVGTSRGAEWLLAIAFVQPAGSAGTLDLNLVHVETGATRDAWRLEVPAGSDPVGVARFAVASLAERLAGLGLGAPGATTAPATYRGSQVPTRAVTTFLQGVRAGDRWRWDAAREAYQRAIREGGGAFEEAGIALRRAARLHSGGTLAGS